MCARSKRAAIHCDYACSIVMYCIVTQAWNQSRYCLKSKFYEVLGYTKKWWVLSLSNSDKTWGFKGLSKSHLFCLSVCLASQRTCLLPPAAPSKMHVPGHQIGTLEGGMECEASLRKVDLMETLMLYSALPTVQYHKHSKKTSNRKISWIYTWLKLAFTKLRTHQNICVVAATYCTSGTNTPFTPGLRIRSVSGRDNRTSHNACLCNTLLLPTRHPLVSFFIVQSSTVSFWSSGPSAQWPFVFRITGCRTNELSVHWDIFQTIRVSEYRNNGTMGSPRKVGHGRDALSVSIWG